MSASPGEPPRVFVSYSWTSEAHVEWVVSLSEKLQADGVDIILDQWDLKEGHDKFHFMERMVSDPSVKKVLVISDEIYSDKADGRLGGVGTETQIISKEIYESTSQEKFVPLVRERNEEGKEFLPVFLRNRMYIDFSNDDVFGEAYDKLIRNIFDRPERKKPPLGKPPAHLFIETSTHVKTAGKFERLKDAVQREKPYTQTLLQEYLDAFLAAFDDFRVEYDRKEAKPFDEIVVESVTSFLPYRDNFIDFVLFVAGYMNEQESYDRIHSFLEAIAPYQNRPANVKESTDNYRFILYELFIYLISCLVKSKRYRSAAFFIESTYCFTDTVGGTEFRQQGCAAFNEFNRTIDELRKHRLSSRRYSIFADMIKERATHTALQFRHLIQTDVLLFIRPSFPEPGAAARWYPRCAIYAGEAGALELFAKATTSKGIGALHDLLHTNNLDSVYGSIGKLFQSDRFSGVVNAEWSWHVDWNNLLNLPEIERVLKVASKP